NAQRSYTLTYATSLSYSVALHPHLPPFPTRRSSDLARFSPARSATCTSRRRAGFPMAWWTAPRCSHAASWESCACRSAPTSCSRSEEHTSELQSLAYLVCRLLLEKKKIRYTNIPLLA